MVLGGAPIAHREVKGEPQRLVMGSTFGMSMHHGLPYSMVSTVVEFEENVRIAWQPRPTQALMGLFIGGRIWRYQLVAQEGGTLVRESWDISQERHPWSVRSLRSKTVGSVTKTLERIAQVVEA